MLVLGFAMLPIRSHISVSTAALVLVIPVVVGSAIGGIKAGVSSVIAGFLVYDYGFIPPYKTLDVGTPQNWAALAVYVIVMLLVASVVASLDSSRVEAQRGGEAAHHLSELSEHLVGDHPVDELLDTIVSAVHSVFAIPGVSLLVLDEGVLKVVATAGEPLSTRSSPDSIRTPVNPSVSARIPNRRASCAPSRFRPPVAPWACSLYARCRRRRTTERYSTPSPMTPRWRSSVHNYANKRCARNCSKRWTAFVRA